MLYGDPGATENWLQSTTFLKQTHADLIAVTNWKHLKESTWQFLSSLLDKPTSTLVHGYSRISISQPTASSASSIGSPTRFLLATPRFLGKCHCGNEIGFNARLGTLNASEFHQISRENPTPVSSHLKTGQARDGQSISTLTLRHLEI